MRNDTVQVWLGPVVTAVVSSAALGAGLLGDDWQDWLSWCGLGGVGLLCTLVLWRWRQARLSAEQSATPHHR